MYSEQGAESIHPEFNSLLARFKCMPSDEKRIRSIFEEHHRKVRPEAKKLVPETKKRVFKAAREEWLTFKYVSFAFQNDTGV